MSASPAPREDWLPVGEGPQPTGSITHLTVNRGDGVSVLSDAHGDIDVEREPSAGLYYQDCRHLSRLLFTFGGVQPILLDAREGEHGLSAVFTNPAIRSPGERKPIIPAQTLILRRRRAVAACLVESIAVSNYGREAVEVDLRVEFEADFRDIFVVRGFHRESIPAAPRTEAGHRRVKFCYAGGDGIERTTTVMFYTPPTALAPNEAVFILQLQPRDTATIEFQVDAQEAQPEEGFAAVGRRVRDAQAEWLSQTTGVETDDDALNAVFQRALLDIEMLRTGHGRHGYIAAGVPWYDTLFGRDSLITGIELLPWNPAALRSAMTVLAAEQATTYDADHDASPGKIPHELRWGELATMGEVPFGRYYGSVDSTPLFIVAAAGYLLWTADEATVEQIWPNIERAMEWCIRESRQGVDGFLCYRRLTAAGLENQGWKDSHDAIVWPNGQLVEAPIGLVEVQGYLAQAYSAYAWMARRLRHGGAPDAEARGAELRQRIHTRMAAPELGYAFCIDGSGKAVPTPASNAGHLLWSGVAEPEQARLVAERLFQPDMFSGWGIRTLSSQVPGYNPLGYHVGSVWPHDNALILHGLRAYGFDEEAQRLARASFEMALGFPGNRVPELFSGDDRGLRMVPTPYPVASRPQAWSAAAIPSILTSLLGVQPGRDGQLRVVRPRLPQSIRWVRLTNVRVGDGSADLMFRRTDGHVSVEVERVRGGLEVSLSQAFFDPAGAPR